MHTETYNLDGYEYDCEYACEYLYIRYRILCHFAIWVVYTQIIMIWDVRYIYEGFLF